MKTIELRSIDSRAIMNPILTTQAVNIQKQNGLNSNRSRSTHTLWRIWEYPCNPWILGFEMWSHYCNTPAMHVAAVRAGPLCTNKHTSAFITQSKKRLFVWVVYALANQI